MKTLKLIMIRPDHVVLAKENDLKANSIVQVGTVIDFPEGKSILMSKLRQNCYSKWCEAKLILSVITKLQTGDTRW
jgi:deoxyribose-phosphate aldolase